jgi:hypothetical protein
MTIYKVNVKAPYRDYCQDKTGKSGKTFYPGDDIYIPDKRYAERLIGWGSIEENRLVENEPPKDNIVDVSPLPPIDATEGAISLANEYKIDLSLVQGTGLNNRILKHDVKDYITMMEV